MPIQPLLAPRRPTWARPLAGIGRRRFLSLAGAAGAWLAAGAAPVLAEPDSSTAETTWWVDDVTSIGGMAPRVRDTLAATARELPWHGRIIKGNSAGALYAPIFVRDMATIQPVVPYFLARDFMQTPAEGFLASQDRFATRNGAVAATLNAQGLIDKATVVSDEETSAVHAAYAFFRAFGGADWLGSDVDGRQVIDRLGDALGYLWAERRWNDSSLIYRGHTTDWGDVKRSAGSEPTDLAAGDELTISPFDQAWHFRALHDYAAMLDAVGRTAAAAVQRTRATQVQTETHARLWQPQRGHYRVHAHATAWTDPFDEDAVIPISSVLSIYAGIASPGHVAPIFGAAARAEAAAGTNRAGLTLSPPYPDDFFQSRRMASGEYQNGAVWDWWGGLQIVSEFEHGQADRAIDHLDAVARAWESVDGVHEWFHIPSQSGQGSTQFAGAAGTMAQAVIRGLFGLDIATDGYRITCRLGRNSGGLRAVRPAGGRIEAVQSAYPAFIFLDIRADTGTTGRAAMRIPSDWDNIIVFVDGRVAEGTRWIAGNDHYVGTWPIGSGTHSIIVAKVA
ncbi:MAG: twin-arginine translocation signal domain-containing protein [Chloroflexi bacterium]|nr:twin-arginine translocation signal domain-containing protein [Chloroflexota bacterium]MCY3959062.1 twin-arginine translocation signal domain-containing protein [Chloroflexota bacterium]